MKLMRRDTETTYVPDCFISAYKTLGYSVVGEEDPTPTAPPLEEQERVVEEAPAETEEVTPAEEIQEAPEQVVSEEKKETEFVCPVCGKNYSRKGNLDKHIEKEHKEA